MTITEEIREAVLAAGAVDYDRVEPITEDDAFLAEAVQEADLPSLLAALALATGDESLLADELKPPLPPMAAVIQPQGGMSAEAQAKARAVALEALKRFRDNGSVIARQPTAEDLERIMFFLTKDAGPEYVPLLQHELGLPRDYGAPTWTKDEVAPDTDFTVAVIGAGFSGLAAAHRLKQAGVPFVVFEKNTEVGGTWWENSYPGCRLDTPNFAYSLSFAQKGDWPQQFSGQPEIHKYLSGVATGFGLREHIRLGTEVLEATFDEDAVRWTLVTRDADGTEETHTFSAVMTAMGQLNRPNYPDIPGRDSFAGPAFHSARWDHSVDLTGRRVAVIGTGASAYQIVPTIVDSVGELTVFQRNAPWMLPTPNYHHDIKPGMLWLLGHVPYYGRWERFWQFWIAAEGRLPYVQVDPEWTEPGSLSAMNAELRRQLLERLDEQFADRPDLRAKVEPTYPPGAKRMTRDNGVWADALKRSHVSLVTEGITEITEKGVRTADGVLHEVDVIVYATGFQASDYLVPMKVTGRGGADLHETWGGDARAHLGVSVPGFPNLFIVFGPNSGVVVNGSSVFMGECAVEYSVAAIGALLRSGHRALDVRPSVVESFCERVDAANRLRAWGASQVSSWYKNAFGRASQVWPFSLLEYFTLTRECELADFELL
ncbi:flavin-containing monooxygenase [Geodermatophilus sp. URMC 64]